LDYPFNRMKTIIKGVAAGLMLLLASSGRAQLVKTAPTTGPKTAGPVLVGTAHGEARRKALLGAIEDYKTFIPDSKEDPLNQKFLEPLGKIKTEAAGLKSGEAVEPVEKTFEDWKQQLLTSLYNEHKDRFFSDPARFSDFMQERLDTLTAIRNQKARAPQQIKKLEALKAQVHELPDRETLDRIYNGVGGSKTSLRSAPIRLVSFTEPAKPAPLPMADAYAPVITRPSIDRSAPPPPMGFEPVSFFSHPLSASAAALSNVISTVSTTAKRYAGKVADAIVTFSKKHGIDERLEAAFIWAESAFNPHAVSSAGAVGLGQLMPGTASGLGVHNAYDIDQNVKGSTYFVKTLLTKFSSDDEMKYMQGLYAQGKDRVAKGQPAAAVWKDCFERTPLGIKNAIAAYNAGAGAITVYAHGDYRQLPRKYTADAQKNGQGYWQTINYVPAVLRHYFDIMVATPSGSSQPGLVSA